MNPIFDIHCHPSLKIYLFDKHIYHDHMPLPDKSPFGMHVDLHKMKNGNVRGVVAVHYIPEYGLYEYAHAGLVRAVIKTQLDKFEDKSKPNGPFEQLKEMIEKFENDIKAAMDEGFPEAVIARNYSELTEYWAAGKTVFVHSVEGAHGLGYHYKTEEEYVDVINWLAKKGVCQFTIAHFFQNDIVTSGGGIPPSVKDHELKLQMPENEFPTLNPTNSFGKNMINKLFDLGIVIDLVHCNEDARKEIFDINAEWTKKNGKKRPLVFSHSGIRECITNPNMLEDDKKCLPDRTEILKIKDTGGVIGVIFMNYWLDGIEEDSIFKKDNGLPIVIETIKKIKEICGNCDHICLGTDLDGFTQVPDDLVTSADIQKVLTALATQGFTTDELEKIAYKNYMRVLKNGWGNN